MKEERTHTRNQRRMYRIHKLEEKVHNQDLLIGSLQSQLKAKEEVIKELENINDKLSNALNSAEDKIDKATKHVSSLSSKGRDCEIYADVKRNILEILSKGENK